ncbi:Na+/H+ antiporter NhaC [Serpentinicella sp. ANB-PHB4]|uniref:Na+/H+ antiporter NhaC n=1 Tax=Serpentinicella sp. ANB-PHB4 TaxID=3074076 RepID=UPI002859DAB1|nr:Na+/H+ antiporter NhaC [Serpentinicella sp. ANB-PHB4]MDR5659638.1 Na+/H+ antiporter NhaC [Serpentinicella sp. ANB-PHB4]
MTTKNQTTIPSFWISLVPFIVMGLSLGVSVFLYDTEPHSSLILGTITVAAIGYYYNHSWDQIEKSIVSSISRAISAIIILLIIGMLIGTWIASGVVPALMYYGFYVFSETWFLPSILVLCSFISVVTGSSWTTAGTIGVAAIGIGQGLGIPAHIIAGAVVSGAFFGDKLSPLSDSTNLTPSLLKVDLYEHIKHMLYTTVPSFVIALILYAIIGIFFIEGGNGIDVSDYQSAIAENFRLSYWLIIPPAAVVTLILFKVPAIPSLAVGVLLGSMVQIIAQGSNLGEVFETLYHGVEISTGWDEMDELLSRGGMSSMYSVVALAIVALPFGGLMNDTGMLSAIVSKMTAFLNTRGPLVLTTALTSIFINIFGANQYLAVILPGQMYEEHYKKLDLHNKNLTRALEGGGTLTAPLIPWNSSGAFMLSVLAVDPLKYAPYAFVCWLTFIVATAFAYFNVTMEKQSPKTEENTT